MRYRKRLLILLFLLAAITYLDRICISVAGPVIQADLGISPKQWGYVMGAFALGYAIFEIPAGMLADRIGARNVLTRVVLWWSLFTVLTGAVSYLSTIIAVVSTFTVLLVVRFLFGAGEAGAFPGATSAVSRWFPAAERGRAQSVIMMAARVGGMMTPLLVVPMQRAWGWQSTFYVFGSVGVIWCAVWYWRYRDRPAEKKGITQTELDEIGAGSGSNVHTPVPWRRVLRRSAFWRLLLMYHTYNWCAYFYLSWLHTYLQKGRGFTPDQMKLWSMLPFALGACAILVGGQLSDRLVARYGLKVGRRAVGVTGLALSAVCLTTTAFTQNPSVAAIFLALAYATSDACVPVSWAIALDVGGKNAGAISGAMNMAGQVGSFMSSIAFGHLIELFGSYDLALLPLAAMVGISSILFWSIDPTEQLVPGEEDDVRVARPQIA